MSQIDGIGAVAVVAVASFAVDRITTGLLFALDSLGFWARQFPEPASLEGSERRTAERRQKWAYYLLAGSLSIPVFAWWGQIRLFQALGFTMPGFLDVVTTGLVLIAGADRVAALVSSAGPASSPAPSGPIEITGKLVLENGPRPVA